ncbi:MAG: ABC transporter permease [Dehalococcoidia bacterium]
MTTPLARGEQRALPVVRTGAMLALWSAGLVRFARRQPVGAASGAVLVAVVLIAVFAPTVARYEPTQVFRGEALLPPSSSHWLGTDDVGRDVWARIIFGTRISVTVGLVPVTIAVLLGWLIGLTSGYFGGWFDLLVQRVIDAWIAFPTLILAITLAAVMKPGIQNVLIAITVIFIPGAVRVVRSVTLPLTESPFVEAARALGASHTRILLRHILPNTVAVVLIIGSISIAGAILTESGLSFLGIGIQPPTTSWGQMLSGSGRARLNDAPWIGIAPGVAIGIVVLAANLFGDALRDHLDPRLRGRDA